MAETEEKVAEFRKYWHSIDVAFATLDAGVCATGAGAAVIVRKHAADARVDALGALLKAKDALADRDAFYLLGTDPDTQLPYVTGKNEETRAALLSRLTKPEREAVHKAEVELARAEVREDGAADDLDVKIAMLYVHAAHGFAHQDAPPLPKQEETPTPQAEKSPDSPVPER